VLSTMERDVALFRGTKNMVEPRFRVQGRGEALVARCRRYLAMAIRASIHDRDTILARYPISLKSPGVSRDKEKSDQPERMRYDFEVSTHLGSNTDGRGASA